MWLEILRTDPGGPLVAEKQNLHPDPPAGKEAATGPPSVGRLWSPQCRGLARQGGQEGATHSLLHGFSKRSPRTRPSGASPRANASGPAGVKASCSHVRAPCDRATHPAGRRPGLPHTRRSALHIVTGPTFLGTRQPVAAERDGQLGQQVGRPELSPQAPSPPRMPAGHPGPGSCGLLDR